MSASYQILFEKQCELIVQPHGDEGQPNPNISLNVCDLLRDLYSKVNMLKNRCDDLTLLASNQETFIKKLQDTVAAMHPVVEEMT